MKTNHLATKLSNEEFSVGTRVLNSWPTIIEIIGQTGIFDYVEFAGEYVPYTLKELDNLARAAELYGM